MEIEGTNTTKASLDTSAVEHWSPTVQLRNVRRVGDSKEDWINIELVLQQLYISNLGREKWEDVPTVIL